MPDTPDLTGSTRAVRKRVRALKPRRGELVAGWSRTMRGTAPELCYAWGGAGAQASEARILCTALEEMLLPNGCSLVQELVSRGFDITTLRFSIEMTQPAQPVDNHD